MRTWTRAGHSRLCGRCSHVIERGEPLFSMTIAAGVYALTEPKIRCQGCAGEPVPANLPPLQERTPITPMAHVRVAAKALPFDYKLAQVSREPGEDG